MNNGTLSPGLTSVHFPGSFARAPVRPFHVPLEKLVYNVYGLTITRSLAAAAQIISLKVVHELKMAPNTSHPMI